MNDDGSANSVTVYASADGWADIVVPFNPGLGINYAWNDRGQGTQQFARNYLATIFGPIQTSGGQTLEPCTLYYACLAALSSASSVVLANLTPASLVSIELWLASVGIGITVAELIPVLALVGITLGLLAVVC